LYIVHNITQWCLCPKQSEGLYISLAMDPDTRHTVAMLVPHCPCCKDCAVALARSLLPLVQVVVEEGFNKDVCRLEPPRTPTTTDPTTPGAPSKPTRPPLQAVGGNTCRKLFDEP
jgi:hypothetical protein